MQNSSSFKLAMSCWFIKLLVFDIRYSENFGNSAVFGIRYSIIRIRFILVFVFDIRIRFFRGYSQL